MNEEATLGDRGAGTDPASEAAPSGEPTSWQREVELRLAAEDCWELLWRAEGMERWLGAGSRVVLREGARCSFADEAGTWRRGTVVSAKFAKEMRLVVGLRPAASWHSPVQTHTTVVFTVRPTQEQRCVLRIEEEGLPAECSDDAQFYWESCLERIKRVERRVVTRRDRARQAVIVIHGIGEQQPGATLRNLIASGVFGEIPASEIWVKPDRLSDSFELRSAVFKASFQGNRPSTEVYELYWAHVIRDTTLSQVGAWARKLLTKSNLPRPLGPIRWMIWGLVGLLTALAVAGLWLQVGWVQWVFAGGAVMTVLGILGRVLSKHLFVDIVGDAARYLLPLPANIAHRQKIREMGVELIEKLHESKRFDRIVVLGHSLGSVIAYDVITHAWTRVHRHHANPGRSSFQEIREVEKALDVRDVEQTRKLQHAAWSRMRQNSQPWLITDLVTVGSPLTYADFLVSSHRDDFKRAKAERTLPACPPVPEPERGSGHRRVSYEHAFGRRGKRSRKTFTFFHHGAPFAVVRWTNLYFATRRFGFVGDLVGGPLAPLFGHWVRDVQMPSPKNGITHTWYWRRTAKSNRHIEELAEALDLQRRRELTALLQQIPSYLLLD